MDYFAGTFDIAVVGAGHAGIEAALAAARLGLKTVCFTINLDAVGNMPCNPAIGGTGKGHLVRELDALGGDGTGRRRRLHSVPYPEPGQGPAVWSLRAQADRREYQKIMKHTLELQENLTLKQAEVVEVLTEGNRVSGVKTATGAVYAAKAAVVCSGTFLGGAPLWAISPASPGRTAWPPPCPLTKNLKKLGLGLRRFKTGTPPRVNARSVDFSRMEIQPGDPDALPSPLKPCGPGEPGRLPPHLHQ